ncbi:IclR family transcriptional regulator [Streptomyces sp. Li-HN-5-11]|uniref:IclR family transcriptional regulator n=1 Tax=Streptomyces sp. Li-HN-5-11 TaxID=3075432 RepID=UPI0028AFF8E9|nr:IclR family transcriptional regulator [Streptomyces sp. Li-HN-5-11]WNM34755.1 IclR family transcriptional regulator [Streptomyces sp. Li-HN-5-11]
MAPSILWKAFDVLGTFSHRHRVLTLAQIARHTGLPKSTVHRVLAMLTETGAVEQTEAGYRVGLRMFALGALPPEAALREAALVHLEKLHRYTSQTLHLAVLRGGDVVYLEKLPSRYGVPSPALVGDRLPAYCTAVGKVLLAHCGDAVTAAALTGPWRPRTAKSLASAEQVLRQLESVRADGLAVDREEAAEGLACVAVPVLVRGRAVAAVSVAFPASAGSGQVLVSPLRQAAAAIARSPAVMHTDDLVAGRREHS